MFRMLPLYLYCNSVSHLKCKSIFDKLDMLDMFSFSLKVLYGIFHFFLAQHMIIGILQVLSYSIEALGQLQKIN